MQKAIFFDRDGVINSNKNHYYIYRVQDFTINPGIIKSLKRFRDAGYLLFVVTNQGGVAKKIYTSNDVEKVHLHLENELAKENIRITSIYYCPHHESVAPCQCRKPSPYFIKQAIKKYHLNPKQSYFIGDSQRDIESAKSAGITGIRILPNENISKYCEQILKKEI